MAVLIHADAIAKALGVSTRTAREYLIKNGAAFKLGKSAQAGVYTTVPKLKFAFGEVADELLAELGGAK